MSFNNLIKSFKSGGKWTNIVVDLESAPVWVMLMSHAVNKIGGKPKSIKVIRMKFEYI